MPSPPQIRAVIRPLLAGAFCWGVLSCSKPPPRRSTLSPATSATATAVDATTLLQRRELGTMGELPAWISHLKVIDLDQDGLDDIVFCEAQDNEVRWIRQTAPGSFAPEALLAAAMRGPVHVEAADMDADGDLDLLVSSMSVVFPNNDRIGAAFILENDGAEAFTPHVIIENTSRIVDMRAADLNGDGRLDLALAQFGYDQGEVAWLEHVGPSPWDFTRHVILELSGAVNVVVDDFNGDRTPDLVALLSQQWEEIYFFPNDGRGRFTAQRIWGSTNEDYGSSGISVTDLNRDGRPDVLYSNGDGFGPAATPGPRPWHGLQWLENTGGGGFRYHRIGDLPGAYSPVGVDFDQDGAIDIVASSAYSDWNNANRTVTSLMWFKNDGRQNFTPHILTRAPKDLITVGTGDFDGSGRPSLVTGGFYIYPPFDEVSRITLWHR
ncbi:FG-GAP repeat domain-containing protein [Synoicihabitans lomoniglobus]|uniref:VCBS repeat-containing protein n=1 Tax=Synoicihabitans lomoniglobus TaxID=2909285 RepID=A0AAE9ZVJ6_9BACT|nr:VCBS repeat-containing protein [Opitutaceae bacterium LMO-M01]WED64936.1 VCBS repeat-containing protein [Opitutaceae bacterium LMO-M01]